MKKIKIAQIGVNKLSHHREIYETLKNNSDIFDFVGYAFPENEKEKYPEECANLGDVNELSLDEILNNPKIEAVTIETDEVHLTKYATLAAKHGKHIHMEKPGGINHDDFVALANLTKEKNLVFHLGYMYRYNPYISELIEKAKSGALGNISSIEAHMSCIHRPENRKWLESLPGGMLFFLGCHLVDIALQIKGEPNEIIPLSISSGADGTRFNDVGVAALKYDDCLAYVKTSCVEAGGFAKRNVVVSGEKGTIEIAPLEMFEGDGIYSERTTHTANFNWGDIGKKEKSPVFDRYSNMMRSFASYVRGEKHNPWSADYEIMLHKAVLKTLGKVD